MRIDKAGVIGRFAAMTCMGVSLIFGAFPGTGFVEGAAEPKSIRMTCGSCPEGYATTGVT